MSSSRFPGKVLAHFCGRPIIDHVLDVVRSVPAIDSAIVVTSDDGSDDSLVNYAERSGYRVFRGPLPDVFRRFQLCAEHFPSEWILRVCADSPLLDPAVLREVLRHTGREECDVVTTRFAPAFPKGQNAELIRASALLATDPAELTEHDREHVTPWFYRHREQYRIIDASPVEIGLPGDEFTVDTPDDLRRLERLYSRHARAVETSDV